MDTDKSLITHEINNKMKSKDEFTPKLLICDICGFMPKRLNGLESHKRLKHGITKKTSSRLLEIGEIFDPTSEHPREAIHRMLKEKTQIDEVITINGYTPAKNEMELIIKLIAL
jgi:hypothetical protein